MSMEYDKAAAEMDLMSVEAEARTRYAEQEPYQAALAAQYRVFHHYFAPPQLNWGSGDQWPADRAERPDKIHVTVNMIRPVLMSGARLESILPRVTIPSSILPERERRRAEGTEQLMMTWLEMSGWDTWMFDFCLSKALYGKGVLKPYWNKEEKRGDVYVIESPWNLRIGYGASDFHTVDWAIYEYSLSVAEIRRRFPKLHIEETNDRKQPLHVSRYTSHDDPLDLRRDDLIPYRQPSEYERRQARIWDYWYKDEDGDIWNAMLVEGVCCEPPKKHPELLKVPYIVVEHDHEPGSPEGTSGAIDLIDLQLEMNRAFSHMFQYVADNVDPAWYLTGESSMSVVEGIVPKAGEIVGVGDNKVEEIPKGQSTVPFTEVIRTVQEAFHRVSGLPEIALGGLASSEISGRAVAVQIQSHANRMDQRRARTYRGLKELLKAWVYMTTVIDPKVQVGTDEEGNPRQESPADLVRGMTNWKIIPPEITPRDAQEQVTVEINKLNAKGQSLRSFMDNTGVENPEAEIEMIKQERMDPQLFAADAQAYLGIITMLQQIQGQMAAQQQQLAAMGGQPQGGQDQGQTAINQMQQQLYAAQPTGFEDQNEPPPQPMTQEGTPPPGNGQGPTGNTTLIRQGVPLNQIAFT